MLIKAVFALYEASQPTGHCLQILIPKEVLEDFVYPSFAYGIPVALYLDGDWTKTAFTLSLTMQHSLPINP